MSKKILFGNAARTKLKEGVDVVANAVKITIGPRGRNVVIDKGWGVPTITNDGVSIARDISLSDKFQNMGADIAKEVATKTNEAAGDGPQPLYSKVLTPNGFVKIGSLKVGDEICGTNGTFQKVLGIFPKGKRDIFKIKMLDGREVECSEDHIWSVVTNYGLKKNLTVKKILEKGVYSISKDGSKKHNYFVPLSKVEYNKKDLSLDPYLLGVLLGDGSMTGSGSVEFTIGLSKEHILSKIKLPDGLKINIQFVEKKNCFRVKISGKTKDGKTIKDIISELDLLGVYSDTKFIPKQYLYSDMKSRIKLLDGLSDTDGHINKRGLLEYSTVSKQLSSDMLELLRSLGKTATSYLKERTVDCGSYSNKSIYVINEWKGYKYGNGISEIASVGKNTEMMCIKVSNLDHLYITDDYVATHNTSTAIVLMQAMVESGFKIAESGVNAMGIKLGMEAAKVDAVKYLKNLSKEISTPEEIEQVATISAESAEIGKIIAETIDKVGKDGDVTVEESQTFGVVSEIVDGYGFDRGYISPYMVTNPDKMEAEYKDIAVLVTDKKISSIKEVLPLLEKLANSGKKDLLIIAEDVEGDALATFVLNKMKGGFNILAVKAPGFGDRKKEILEDIAITVGATVISAENGLNLEMAALPMLGVVSKVLSTKDKTLLVGGSGDKGVVASRIASIKVQLETTESKHDKEKMKERIGKLSKGVAVIRVGAATETEMKYLKLKIEDAVNATKAAIEEGIVIGGGAALIKVAQTMRANPTLSPKFASEFAAGYEVVVHALLAPLAQIAKNCGKTNEEIQGIIDGIRLGVNIGYDALGDEIVGDMFLAGIIDPVKVTRCAVEHSISAASILLTTEVAITEEDKKEDDLPMANF